jgi:hypothetical protein
MLAVAHLFRNLPGFVIAYPSENQPRTIASLNRMESTSYVRPLCSLRG